ncbi:hypothetical protein [Desulfosporosinus shakirovi]|uniref:hypothetical protein n=1 Tax=Desulfosporosinus shakirovi TaxID=2885154 RepID=UPI001E5BDA3E|nr:hypothetical protein [Desulfosporosinus sp. SRJS8]MCB8817372.1 hypothetical protein [Desulfosporosinus sp. SRJS8]
MNSITFWLKNKKWVIRIVIIFGILLLSWFVQWRFTSIKPNDASEIQRLILDSVATEQTAIILAEPYRSNPNISLTDEVKKIANENIEDKLSKSYTPNSRILKKIVGQSVEMINAQETGNYRFSDGGVSKYKNIKISGHVNMATVSADIWVWNKALINNVIAHPEVGLHYRFSVVRTGNKWAINDESSHVIPGEGA